MASILSSTLNPKRCIRRRDDKYFDFDLIRHLSRDMAHVRCYIKFNIWRAEAQCTQNVEIEFPFLRLVLQKIEWRTATVALFLLFWRIWKRNGHRSRALSQVLSSFLGVAYWNFAWRTTEVWRGKNKWALGLLEEVWAFSWKNDLDHTIPPRAASDSKRLFLTGRRVFLERVHRFLRLNRELGWVWRLGMNCSTRWGGSSTFSLLSVAADLLLAK